MTAREDGQVIVNTAFVESAGANVRPGCPDSAAGCGTAAIVANLSTSRGSGQGLAFTGGRVGPWLLMAAGLLAVGAILTMSGTPGGVRRRRDRG